MFGLDQAINNAVFKMSGGEKGDKTRTTTLLDTDKIVTMLMIMMPLGLLAFTKIFAPQVFTHDSINCAPYQTLDLLEDISEGKAKMGLGYNERFYMHKYCWNRPSRAGVFEIF